MAAKLAKAKAQTGRGRKMIPRPRTTSPTPAPPPVPVEQSRLYRGYLPEPGAHVTAVCGCAGLVDRTSRHFGGYVRLRILVPCTDGRHERWAVGVVGGFFPNEIPPAPAVVAAPEPEPAGPEATAVWQPTLTFPTA